ncbi:MAG: twin-arginine translocase TatA/TatE family subunit [Thermosynechococcaceae cyanobacterium MS004]|jgi:sec-independent protein translocase protein TatA|nr:twin-arginine translocase TatA/TatE family subunit [Thermosynechococcaceae cyanobacterium MS004]
MFNLGWVEGGLIILVAVLVFGSKRLPELGGALGKALRGLKEEVSPEESTQDPPDDLR